MKFTEITDYTYTFPVVKMVPCAGNGLYMHRFGSVTEVFVSSISIEVTVEGTETQVPYIYVAGNTRWQLYTDTVYPVSIFNLIIDHVYSGEERLLERLRQDPDKKVTWTEQGMQEDNKASLETGWWLCDFVIEFGNAVEYKT